MNEEFLDRSPHLMSRGDTALLVVDVQEKLIQLIPEFENMIWNIRRLIDGAQLLDVPVLATEQYPQGLGSTTPVLAERLERVLDKTSFSCAGCAPLLEQLAASNAAKLLVCGIEAHVCVQQTVLDLLARGLAVFVAVDATGARHAIDYRTAMGRMEAAGAVLTTTEAALFEWCERSGTPQFKQISQLVREEPPG